jgi:hypothetical protein
MRSAFHARSTGKATRFAKRWTAEEIAFACDRLVSWTPARIAAHLGRTVPGLRRMLWSRRITFAMGSGFVSSGEASRLSGFSRQQLTYLARRGVIVATRIPGGRNWYFAPDALPMKTATRRGRWRNAA